MVSAVCLSIFLRKATLIMQAESFMFACLDGVYIVRVS